MIKENSVDRTISEDGGRARNQILYLYGLSTVNRWHSPRWHVREVRLLVIF
jgi:hypothetical protein